MYDIIQKYKKGNQVLSILRDEDIESANPREWDNLGIMICSHRRYSLGDKQFSSLEDFLESEQLQVADVVCVMPLYLYDHSGLAMSIGDFSDFDPQGWDSGQVGVIIATRQRVKEFLGFSRITKNRLEKIKKILTNEVNEYDMYLHGEVYGWELNKVSTCDLDHEHEELIESCGGYLGEDSLMDELKSTYKIDQWQEI